MPDPDKEVNMVQVNVFRVLGLLMLLAAIGIVPGARERALSFDFKSIKSRLNAVELENDTAISVIGAITESGHPSLILDSEGVVTFANQSAIKFFQVDAYPDLQGRNISEWLVDEKEGHHIPVLDLDTAPGQMACIHKNFVVKGKNKPAMLNRQGFGKGKHRVYRLDFYREK